MDGEDQRAAVVLPGGKGPETELPGREVKIFYEQRELETSLVQRKPLQTSMITPKISQHIPINEAHLEYINSNLEAIRGSQNMRPRSGGNGEILCL